MTNEQVLEKLVDEIRKQREEIALFAGKYEALKDSYVDHIARMARLEDEVTQLQESMNDLRKRGLL